MDVYGKWKVVKVFKDFTPELQPIYVSKDEALALDQYKDANSLKFITSTYEITNKGINIINTNNEVVETLKVKEENGKLYLNEGEPAEITLNDDGTINFMIMLILGRI